MIAYPMTMSAEQKNFVRDGLTSIYAGQENAGKVLVVDAGAKFETISFTPEDAQFLEQRKLSNEDTARIFSTPPTACGITDKSTYSNTEQESRALVQNALAPLASRIETAMARCLLTDVGRRTLYVQHDLDGLLRGDVKSRFDAYRLGREIGVFSPNDVRKLENQPPIENGGTYHIPANWLPLGTVPQQGAAP